MLVSLRRYRSISKELALSSVSVACASAIRITEAQPMAPRYLEDFELRMPKYMDHAHRCPQ